MIDEFYALAFRLESNENLLDERGWSIPWAQPHLKKLMYERRWFKYDSPRVMNRKHDCHSGNNS